MSVTTIGKAGFTAAVNGTEQISPSTIGLGGTLIQDTIIDVNTFTFTMTDTDPFFDTSFVIGRIEPVPTFIVPIKGFIFSNSDGTTATLARVDATSLGSNDALNVQFNDQVNGLSNGLSVTLDRIFLQFSDSVTPSQTGFNSDAGTLQSVVRSASPLGNANLDVRDTQFGLSTTKADNSIQVGFSGYNGDGPILFNTADMFYYDVALDIDVALVQCRDIEAKIRYCYDTGLVLFNEIVVNAGGATLDTLQVVMPNLGNFANDGAAAAGGVPLMGLYHTAGAVKIRIV